MITAPAKRSHRLQDRLDLLAIQIDSLLESLSGASLLEARRSITRDLHFEPRAEQLQTISRVAADDCVDGPRRETPRRFLGLWILADRTVKNVQQSRKLDAASMDESAQLLVDLLDEARRLEAELEWVVATDETLDRNDRDYLLRVGEAFSFSQYELIANVVLAQRLSELAQAASTDSLEAAEPFLTAGERERVAGFAASNITQETSRAELDAVATRTLMESLLARWDELGPPSGDDAARRLVRDRQLERMRDAQAALDSVAARIQIQCDAALVANVGSLADELRDAGRGLFSIKLRMVPILRSPYEDNDEDRESLREKLAESAAEEQAADTGPRRESEDELYLGALKDMRSRKETQEFEFLKTERVCDAKRARRRMAALVVTACVLALTSAIVNFVVLPRGKKAPVGPSLQELRPVIKAKRVETAGPLMITHVEGWNDLHESKRQQQVDRLGQVVAERDFQMMFVVDEYAEVGAAWDGKSGAGLIEAPR